VEVWLILWLPLLEEFITLPTAIGIPPEFCFIIWHSGPDYFYSSYLPFLLLQSASLKIWEKLCAIQELLISMHQVISLLLPFMVSALSPPPLSILKSISPTSPPPPPPPPRSKTTYCRRGLDTLPIRACLIDGSTSFLTTFFAYLGFVFSFQNCLRMTRRTKITFLAASVLKL